MANAWEAAPIVNEDQPAWKSAPIEQPAYSGTILPFSRDQQGNVSFDSNAGVVGMGKRALQGMWSGATLPGDVYTGKTDPTSPEGVQRATELAAMATPMSPASRLAGSLAAPILARSAETPSTDALYGAARAAYDRAGNMGVDYSSDAVTNLAQALKRNLDQEGRLATLAPATHSILDDLVNAPKGSVVPLNSLEAARKAFGNAGKNFNNPTDQAAALQTADALRSFMANPPQGAVVAGPADEAAAALREAGANYGAAKRSERLFGPEDQSAVGAANRADLATGAAHSGTNSDNALRQQVKSILLNQKKSAGYSPEELAALQKVVTGTPLGNAVRYAGNLAGGGGGLGAVVSGGASGLAGTAAGGPIMGALVGAGIPLAGYGLKKLGGHMTEKALAEADNLIRSRSPLAQQLQAQAPQQVANPEFRAALARALLAGGANQPQQ